LAVSTPGTKLDLSAVAGGPGVHPVAALMGGAPWGLLWGMKKWLAWVIVGGPVVVYAIGKFLSH
jgi:hypothetical protein